MPVLGDYVDLIRGKTYKGALVGRPGPALLGLGSIVPGGGFRHDFKTYGGECPPALMLAPGDLYVALKGATKDGEMIGSIARLPESVSAGRLTQDTVRLVFRRRDPPLERYIYWLLRTSAYRAYCAGRATGSAVVALSRADFLSYPVPTLTRERNATVDVLEAIDDKIESNRRAGGIALELATSLLLGGTETIRLGDIADLDKGLSYKGAGLNDGSASDAIPMINLANFERSGALKPSGLKYYTGDFKSKHRLAAWDLVVANTDLTQSREILGRGVLVPSTLQGAIHTHHTSVVRFRESPELALFVWAGLQSPEFRERAKGFATGTTVTALPREALLNFAFRVAADTDAPLVVARPLIAHSWHLTTESAALATMRDTLLPELLSNRLRVPSVAAVVQDG